MDIVMSLKKEHVRGKVLASKGFGHACEYYVAIKGSGKIEVEGN